MKTDGQGRSLKRRVVLAASLSCALLLLVCAPAFAGTPNQLSLCPAGLQPLQVVAGQTLSPTLRLEPMLRACRAGEQRVLCGISSQQNARVTSSNWAGYDVTGAGVSNVTASWVEPTVPVNATTTYASFWVGLDGDGSSTLEQVGTTACCQNGCVHYYAWHQMYPAVEAPIQCLSINPGDSMTGAVSSNDAGMFTITLVDHSSHNAFTSTQWGPVGLPSSAEIVAEAPTDASLDTIMPLANFGTVAFGNCAFNGRPLSDCNLRQIAMVANDGSLLAAASALDGNGTDFTVTSYPALSSPPTLTCLTPGSGPVGSSVTLTGSALSGVSAVAFHGVTATWRALSPTAITATVPAGATTGTITVTGPSGAATTATNFTITAAMLGLRLRGLDAGAISLGDSITISTHPAGSAPAACTFTVQRDRDGRWLPTRTWTRPIGVDGICSATYQPTKAGTYRVRAATASEPVAATTWTTFSVKQTTRA